MGYSTNKRRFRGKTNSIEDDKSVGRFIITTWILAISVIFPLIVHHAYFDILQTKFYFFAFTTGGMILLMFAVIVMNKDMNRMLGGIREKGLIRWLKEELDFVDRCILIFWIFAAISTILTFPRMQYAFFGHKGRYTGLLLLSLYTLAYFFVSRYITFRKYVFLAFTLVGDLVCLFGIFDYFRMNLFGFEDQMAPEQIGLFSSTIGNINTFTTYVGFVVAFAGAMFVISRLRDVQKDISATGGKSTGESKNSRGESRYTLVFYYVSMVIGFFALTLGKSDNAYLTLLAFFGFLPFLAFRTNYGIRRYVLTLATYLSVVKLIDIINRTYTGPVSGIDGFFLIIINFLFLEATIVLLWGITVLLYALEFKKQRRIKEENKPDDASSPEKAPKVFFIGWTVFFCTVFLVVVGTLIYVNTRTYEELEFLGDLRYYLYFQDTWGTFRGYIWRVTLEEYGKMSLLHKIFGSGPDTFGIYMIVRRGNEMLRTTGTHYDSAHNEYLHYLVTVGPIALLAYLGILGKTIKRGLSKLNHTEVMPYMAAASFLVICYAIQALVNINLPISTPVMWMFLMMIAGITRSDRKGLL